MVEAYSKNKKFKGFNDKGINTFLGIPYATPPIGKLRFKAPQKLSLSNKETIVCENYPANPIQNGQEFISEDCLQLNIWQPTHVTEKLPVMVWIYGGSFETGGIGKNGAGFGLTFDGNALATDSNCVVITINYRLNVFGFLDFSSLSDQFETNIGLKDVFCALEWIKDNVSEFGGDASNVTVFGQSAGGALVAALSKVPSAQDLFHKMIIQSACFESFYSKEEAKELTKKYLNLLDISENEVDTLLTLPSERLLSVTSELEKSVRQNVLGITTFCPVIDGNFLTEFPYLGDYATEKPLIVGSTKNEGRMFTKFSKEIAEEKGPRFFPYISEAERTKIISHYEDFPSFKENAKLITDIMYTVPKYWMADNYSKTNQVYVYRFDFYSGFFRFASLKACHASDVPILFNVGAKFYFEGIFTAKKIGRIIRTYWGNFARTGNPNGADLPEWEAYKKDNKNVLIFEKNSFLAVEPDKKVTDIYEPFNGFFHKSSDK